MRTILAAIFVVVALGVAHNAPALQPAATATAVSGETPATPEPVNRPRAAGRVVRVFDFEEEADNPNPVPRNWSRSYDADAARPAFPPWNKPEIVYASRSDTARAMIRFGDGAVRVPSGGGSAKLTLDSGAIPVFVGTDHLVTAKIRTRGLRNSRAVVSAFYSDGQAQPVESTRRATGPIIAEEDWTGVTLELRSDQPDIAFLQIELALLQPDQLEEGAARGDDYDAEAWFDDVTVTQLPRVEMRTNSPVNIITAPQRPELTMSIRDLTGDGLSVWLRVYNAAGAEVATTSLPVIAGSRTTSWSPELAAHGWYRAAMEVRTPFATLGGTQVDFLWLAPAGQDGRRGIARANAADRLCFGLDAPEPPDDMWNLLHMATRQLGGSAITLPLWTPGFAPRDAGPRADRLIGAVERLAHDYQEVTLAVPELPQALIDSTKLEGESRYDVFKLKPEVWSPYFEPMLDKLGQRVNRWRLGPPGDPSTQSRPDLDESIARVHDIFAGIVAGPVLLTGASAEGVTPQTRYPLVLRIPGAASPAGSAALASLWGRDSASTASGATPVPAGAAKGGAERGSGAVPRRTIGTAADDRNIFAIEPLDATDFGPQAAASDAAKRAVELWAVAASANTSTPPPRMLLLDPWRFAGRRTPQLVPHPALASWRTTAEMLVDRRAVGRFPAPPGVVCHLFVPADTAQPERGAVLVAWNESADPQDAVIESYFGPDPLRATDTFGNAVPIRYGPARAGYGKPAIIPVGGDPVFIEGVDARLVQLLAAIRVEPGFIHATNEARDYEIVLENPFNIGIRGQLTITEPTRGTIPPAAEFAGSGPAGEPDPAENRLDRQWKISPRTGRFILASGERAGVPFTLVPAASEETGPKRFAFELELVAEHDYPRIEIRRTLELIHPTMRVDLSYTFAGADRQSVIIEATITNTGSEPTDLTVTLFAPNQPRMPASISGLQPGTQMTRRFTLADPIAKLRDQRVMLTAVAPDGRGRLTSSVLIR